MLLLERHLTRQFATTVAAVTVVLLLVGVGGLFADVAQKIAQGRVPASLLLSQLGLRTVQYLPMILPLALFIGLLLAISRLYAESEMAVLAAIGLGPQKLWRPLLLVTAPVALVVALASLWLGPASAQLAQTMVKSANRSFLVAGLDAGRFVELPGRAGVLYVGELSRDGTAFRQLFVQSERDGRLDIVTASAGELVLEGETQRYLRLHEGFRAEGAPGRSDFRILRFAENELRVPDREETSGEQLLQARSSVSLLGDAAPVRQAELHWRLATPLFTLMLGVIAMPLARMEPRQARYGRLLVALLVYVIGINLMLIGRSWLGNGSVPAVFGLWWLHLPAAGLALLLFWRDGRLPKRRVA